MNPGERESVQVRGALPAGRAGLAGHRGGADANSTPPAPAARGSRTAGGGGKIREPFFDNAKYLAIVLVAMGHSWEPLLARSRPLLALYLTVYAFHMPAFVLISGYLSRGSDLSPGRARKLVTTVAVPYAVFECAYAVFLRLTDPSGHAPVSLLDPWWLDWFLIALFVWRLTTPLWRVLRWPLPVAVACAALASLSPGIGDDLDLQRVLQFLPYYVAGLSLRPAHFALLRRKWPKIVAVPVFTAALGAAYWLAPRLPYAWLYHRESAQELGAPWWSGVLMTLALLVCSLVLTACFLAWVPRRAAWITRLGAGTIGGYLLHGFLVKTAVHLGLYRQDWVRTGWGGAVVTLAAGTAVSLLCASPVRRAFRWVLEPRLKWAFRTGS
ncbi:acyltransferase family protein [Streptomyces sp. NPDC007088]|uniref:acyltransferase family protein n=1 Tax=Streptomyces sp. NPDC007088 TaxID=3364773 RepID=UPI00369DDF70